MKIDSKILLEMIEQEIESIQEVRKEPHDHEGRMARGEIRNTIKNSLVLYKLIGKNDELPGWVSSYISLANDYINSVTQFMVEDQVGEDDEEDEEEEEPDEDKEDEEEPDED
jgi:hypothetical protein